MSFVLRVNTVAGPPGTDITEYVPLNGKSIKLTRQINGRGQLSFDAEGDVSDLGSLLAPGVAVSFTEGGDLLFGGIIDSVEETGVYPGADETRVRYSVECVSFATILDRRIVRQVWIGQTAADIMDDIVAEYIGSAADYPEGFNSITWTGGIDGSTVIPRLEAFYKPVSWILDQICKLVGADWSVPPAATSIVFTGDGGGAAITQRNMIAANSGFESNSFSYWTYWNTATDHEISSASKWEGTYSYYITNTSEDAGIYRNVTTVEGYRYVVSVYCYNVTSSGSTMRLEVTDASGSPVATAYPQTTGAWERLVVSYAPQGAYMTVRLGGVGQAYFDAAMVELDGNMSGRAGTYLPGDALPKDAHRISLRKDRDSYVNSVIAARYEKRSEQLPGDGERRNFRTDCYMISPPEITVTDRDGVTTERLVLSETEATANPITTIQSDISGLGWTQPSAGNRTVRMKSSSAIDINIGVRIIGTYDISGVDGTYSPVQDLNGTNWVYFDAEDWTSIAAIYVEDPPDGTITIEVGGTSWSTVVELSPYQMTAGVVELPSAGLGIHMRPFFLLDADLGSDVVRVIHRSDGESGWDMLPDATGDPLCSYSLSYEPASLTADCSTDYYSGVYSENINAVFVGNIPSARKLSVYAASFEWQYNLNTHRIEQNDMKALATDITPTTLEYVARTLRNGEGGALAGPDTIHIDYHGLWIQQKVSQSATEIAARAAAEGGSGLYEHAEILDEFWGPATQTALADGLITYYSRNTGGSLFPRQTLTFATWSYRFRTPGNRFTATLARHGLDADTFTITQVDMSRTSAPAGTSLAWEYTITASIGRASGDWAKRFKDLLPARRILWARTNR